MTAATDLLPVSPDLVWGSELGTYELRPPGRLAWSPGLMRLYGVTEAPRSSEAFMAMIHPDDRARVERHSGETIAAKRPRYSQTFRIIRPDGQTRIVLDRGSIEWDAQGNPLVLRGFNVDVTDESNLNYSAERQLRMSEERYRKLFDRIAQGFCILEVSGDEPGGRADYRVVEANPAFFTLTGFPAEILGSWLREAAPGLEEHWFDMYAQVARTGEPVHLENRADVLDRWYEVYAYRLDEPESKMVAVLFSDATERHRKQEQLELTLGEVNHRSKNLLGVIQAIARNTMTEDPTEFVARFGERVRALAATNDLLVRSGWKPVALEELVRSQLGAFADAATGRFDVTGPVVDLSPGASKALGMALHELATNAAKYGALSRPEGRVRISWGMDPESKVFRMDWQETGGPPVEPPRRQGFGWKVTKQMVEATTSGKVEVDYAVTGLVWRLECPARGVLT